MDTVTLHLVTNRAAITVAELFAQHVAHSLGLPHLAAETVAAARNLVRRAVYTNPPLCPITVQIQYTGMALQVRLYIS